jgi:hypothetical protein
VAKGITTERVLFATLAELLSALSCKLDPSTTVLTAPNGQRYRGADVVTVTHPDGSRDHNIELLEEYGI